MPIELAEAERLVQTIESLREENRSLRNRLGTALHRLWIYDSLTLGAAIIGLALLFGYMVENV